MAGQAIGWYEQVQESQRTRDQAILEQQQIINEGYKNQQDKVNLQQQQVEDQASSLYNPNNPQSLDQIAQYLGDHHDSRGQMAAIHASSIAKSNAITAQLNSLKIHSAQMEEAGPILSSITDQNSYDRGIKQLSDIGLNLKQLGITGDPLVDIPNMPRLTLSTISLQERATMENQKLQRLAQQERTKTQEMRTNQQADYQNARLAQFDNAQKAADQRRQDQERDTLLKQNNLITKQKSALQKLTVPNMTRLAEANSLLRADPFFDNYSDDQFKSASSMIAARAGAILGQKFDPSKTSDNWQPSDMDEAMREAVEEAKNDGKLTQIKKPSWLESILSGGTAQQTGGVSTQTASGKVTQSTVNNKVPLSKITPSKDPASYSGPLSVKKAYENGALSYDEAASILKKRGWAK